MKSVPSPILPQDPAISNVLVEVAAAILLDLVRLHSPYTLLLCVSVPIRRLKDLLRRFPSLYTSTLDTVALPAPVEALSFCSSLAAVCATITQGNTKKSFSAHNFFRIVSPLVSRHFCIHNRYSGSNVTLSKRLSFKRRTCQVCYPTLFYLPSLKVFLCCKGKGTLEGDLVGRKALLDWLNGFLQMHYTKIEQLASGAAYCQLFDALHPGTLSFPLDFNG